ncbi:hypothetical protein PAMC26510_35725 [Caballeronia sordidicola]|uniref:Uncharacterized protein n=1 Tax=Caballeronia sordidicola TaxID=196367 RepID=A0A242M667_CABSO|nr:hypothetical protein PAMC26510_35725 [Caballeronia sordidicola]
MSRCAATLRRSNPHSLRANLGRRREHGAGTIRSRFIVWSTGHDLQDPRVVRSSEWCEKQKTNDALRA